eukprot:gene14831-17009_t
MSSRVKADVTEAMGKSGKKDKSGNTALINAAMAGKVDLVKSLLKGGADINQRGRGGDTALILAAHEGHLDIVNLLLQYPVQLNLKNNTGFTALIIAAARNYTDICAALLDHGANVNMKDKIGESALQWAAYYNHLPTVHLLFDRGAKPSQRNQDGETALSWATSKGHAAVVSVLLNAGADVNTKDSGGYSPLMIAARAGYTEIVRELLQQTQIKLNSTNLCSASALSYACEEGHTDIVALLLQHGAFPNKRGMDETTPLMLAVQAKCAKCVYTLLQHGADRDLANVDGKTALQMTKDPTLRALLRSPPPPPSSTPTTAARVISHMPKSTASTSSDECATNTKKRKHETAQVQEVTARVIQVKEENVVVDTHVQVTCDDTVHTSVSSASSITSGNSHQPANRFPVTPTGTSAHRLVTPTPALPTASFSMAQPTHAVAASTSVSPTTPNTSKVPVDINLVAPITSISTSTFTSIADNTPKALDCISWLGTALTERGTSPHWVRECEACLVVREGFCTRESFAAVPKDRMNHAYLSAIGITGLGMQQIVLQLHRDMNA